MTESNAGKPSAAAKPTKTLWINHLALLPGDPSVQTSFNAVSSGVGGGLSGLIVRSSSIGGVGQSGGGKAVETALEVPPGFNITGVRICFENSNPRSFISQIRLAQVQDPPSTAVVRMDDPTHLNMAGPVCVDSQNTTVDPTAGPVLLSLNLNFGDTSDRIVIRGLGLHLA